MPLADTAADSPTEKGPSSPQGASLLWWLRGVAELARARFQHARIEARDIPSRNRKAALRADHTLTSLANDAQMAAARIGYLLPRLARRMPWRADCLVQALAAQNWLGSKGMAVEIRIGIARTADGAIESHAWSLVGDTIVTGGEIDRFEVVIGASPEP